MKKPVLVVVMLAMVLAAIVPALAQDGEFDVTPAPEPVPPCGWTSSTGAYDPSGHAPGEFVVYYYSEEEMWAAPQENVTHTSIYDYAPYPYQMQYLRFEGIASIPDPCTRFATEEAKLQEILAWPGVKQAGYNIYIPVEYDVPPAA